jgi:hypothetical protein
MRAPGRSTAIALLATAGFLPGLILCTARRVDAVGVQQAVFRAADGTAYQVITAVPPLGSGGDEVRLTTIGASGLGTTACTSGQPLAGHQISALGGVHPPLQQLLGYGNVVRTGILTPNDINTVMFDMSFGGRVGLGTGAAALTVCASPFDCMAQPNVQTTVALNSSAGGVPAACIADGIAATCDAPATGDAFGFNSTATGYPPLCTSSDVTVNSTVCASPPSDGFTLRAGQAIVFIYDTAPTDAFFTSFGGFLVDTNTVGSICPMSSEIVAPVSGNTGGGCGCESPTNTPAMTPSATSAPTITPTVTVTRTPTATLYPPRIGIQPLFGASGGQRKRACRGPILRRYDNSAVYPDYPPGDGPRAGLIDPSVSVCKQWSD